MENRESTKVLRAKITLIDLMMIIMFVGIVLTLFIPLQQTKKQERIVKSSLKEMQRIVNSNEEYYSIFNSYSTNFSYLNLRDIDNTYFEYTLSDTAVVASTNKLGPTTKSYYYDLKMKKFKVYADSKDVIIDTWLP